MAPTEVGQEEAPRLPDAASELEERVLWTRFRSASNREEFFASWLAFQCRLVDGVSAGLLLLRDESGASFDSAAGWPEGQRSPQHLLQAAHKVLSENRALALQLDPQGDRAGREASRTVIGQVVELEGQPAGAVVLEVEPRPGDALEGLLRRLGWGLSWIELALQRDSGVAGRAGQLDALLDIVASPLEHERFRAAATAFVTELATRLECERASLGTVRRDRVRLQVVSHSAQFSEHANLGRALEAAMEEALDQEGSVVWPAPAEKLPQVTRCHEALAQEGGAGCLLSIPIAHGGRFCGVVTLERETGRPFARSEQQLVETVVDLAGPMLDIQYRDDRWIGAKILDSARENASRLVGPGRVGMKLGVGLASLVLLFLLLAHGDYRVVADSEIEARVMRAAVAPFDGYIAEAPARAGDRVREGELLARLDDRDLRLQRARFSSEVSQLSKEMQQAMAQRNAADVHILSARVEQVRAELELAESQLAKTRILAPFDGVVVTGDLSQHLESPVQRGDLLFEVAPEGEFRVVVEVDESEIDEVALGQTGELMLAAFPDRAVEITVAKITPVSEASEGRNYFRIEAEMQDPPARIQPGMEGVAKIGVGQRRQIWIWGHEIVDWMRLTLWRWTP